MGLLPEDTAANHISKVLDAAAESGLPVWTTVTADQCKRFIFAKVPYESVKDIDHQLVHDSYLMALSLNKSWGPWYIGNLLFKRREAAYKKDARKPVCNPIAQGIVDKCNATYGPDTARALEMMKADKPYIQVEKCREVQKRKGNTSLTPFKAYMILAQEERENNDE